MKKKWKWSHSIVSHSLQPYGSHQDPPGSSSIHGIFEARILEWVVIFFSRGSSQPRDRTQVSHAAGRLFTDPDSPTRGWTCISCGSHIAGGFFTAEPLGKPWACIDNDSYVYFMNKFLCDNLVQILYEHWECYEFYFILAFFFKLQTKLQHMACY